MITKKDIHHIHDKAYKNLFQKPEALIDLIKNQLNVSWADLLCDENLTLISTENNDEDLNKTESDIIYQANINGQEIIFYILLELQSSVDPTMPFRIFQYMYLQLSRYFNGSLKTKGALKLPAIYPIVLYNGKTPWHVPLEFKELYYQPDLLGSSILNFKYDIIDIKHDFTKDQLLNHPNLMSILFLFDQSDDVDELQLLALEVQPIFKQLVPNHQNIIVNWITDTAPSDIATPLCQILKSNTKEDVKMITNIRKNIEQLKNDERQVGIDIGTSKGIDIGIERMALQMAETLLPHFDDATIADMAKLPIEKITEIRLKSLEK